MDPLADVLQTLLLRSLVLYRGRMTPPWGIRFGTSPVWPSQEASFHVITRGRCLMDVDGQAETIPLEAGDLVVLPHGHGHSLRDAYATPVLPLEALQPERHTDGDGVTHFGSGDRSAADAAAEMVCGTFFFRDAGPEGTAKTLPNPLRAALPPVLLVRGEGGRPAAWLAATLDLLLCEVSHNEPGAQTVMSRLADVLFIQTVRAFLTAECDSTAAGRGGNWLRALADRQIGPAMAAIHRDPGAEWTVEALARAAGLSRSAFAERFARLVGEPPLRYVTRWRLYTAARLLDSGGSGAGRRERGVGAGAGPTLAEVAARVGYASEAAFSNAFKRWTGVAPGAYRRGEPHNKNNGGAGASALRAA
mgnify:CR=1 FL=1|jgi:AraC-type DNA-binding domain-containing proteins